MPRLLAIGLIAVHCSVLSVLSPVVVVADDWGAPDEPGVVHLVRSGVGRRTLVLRDGEGHVPADALAGLLELMAPARPGARKPGEATLDPRLALLLAAVSDHFGGRTVTLVSGVRSPGGHTRSTSRHVSGSAADIRIDGVPNRALWDYCLTLARTGCGLYPQSTFVHVDVRERAGTWVDWSGPGQRPRYGTLDGPFRSRAERRAAPRFVRTVSRDDVALVARVVPGHGR
jgi:hypothetical protein